MSSDLKSQDSEIRPVYADMPIVKLLKDQVLELEATAILGRGKRHVKFSPGLAYYSAVPKITVHKKDPKEFKDKYPSQILDKKGMIDIKLINTVQLVDACKGINPDIIDVQEKENEFEFYLESWGQLSIKQVFSEAVKIFNGKLDEFEKLVKKLK